MLTIRLEIKEIDYPRTVEALLPHLVRRCRETPEPRSWERLVGKLDGDAVPVARGVLERLDPDSRDALVVWLLTAHETWTLELANRALNGLLAGEVVQVTDMAAVNRPGPCFSLLLQATADYPALLSSPLVRSLVERVGPEDGFLRGAALLALQMGSRMAPQDLERQAAALLGSERVKGRLLAALTGALEHCGIFLTFHDALLEAGDDVRLPEPPASDALPQALKDALTDALADYLRSTLPGNN